MVGGYCGCCPKNALTLNPEEECWLGCAEGPFALSSTPYDCMICASILAASCDSVFIFRDVDERCFNCSMPLVTLLSSTCCSCLFNDEYGSTLSWLFLTSREAVMLRNPLELVSCVGMKRLSSGRVSLSELSPNHFENRPISIVLLSPLRVCGNLLFAMRLSRYEKSSDNVSVVSSTISSSILSVGFSNPKNILEDALLTTLVSFFC